MRSKLLRYVVAPLVAVVLPVAIIVVFVLSFTRSEPVVLVGYEVGTPQVIENLTVFPITAATQHDIGRVTTLHHALAAGTAVVREVGAGAIGAGEFGENGERPQLAESFRGGAPDVGTLVIENRGEEPVYVLAGTVVRGGNQDRQVAQDFLVASGQTVPVDAFCVEQGRWEGAREGESTFGEFSAAQHLATVGVRTAGQYQRDQGAVWERVSSVNLDNAVSTDTGTLLATLENGMIAARRGQLAARALKQLESGPQPSQVVGFACAVDGEIKSARWFANHELWKLFRSPLVEACAMDAITARGGRPPLDPPTLEPDDVATFIAEIDRTPPSRLEQTAADNDNEYTESEEAFRARTFLKPAAAEQAAGSRAAAQPVPLSVDLVRK